MAFGFPASYKTEIEITGSHRDIRDAILRTFELLSWSFSTDEGVHLITAHVPSSLASWGEEFSVSLAEEPIVILKSKCGPFQIVDWGKNKRNVERFLEVFHTRLIWVSGLSDSPPVYLDDAGRTPVERVIGDSETTRHKTEAAEE